MQKKLLEYTTTIEFKDFITQTEKTISMMALPHTEEEVIQQNLIEMGSLYNHFIIKVSKDVISFLEEKAPHESVELRQKSLATFLLELEKIILDHYGEAFSFFLGYRARTKQ